MTDVPIDRLVAHPENANRMPPRMLAKLAAHIDASGEYPPIIVRRRPDDDGRYEILDGHHRVEALRRLGRDTARCEIWEADDERARVLLLTLNRLQGTDDPERRGALLKRLAQSTGVKALAAKLPDDAKRIARLLRLADPPPTPAKPPKLDDMPHAVTFFLDGARQRRLIDRLDRIDCDHSRALVVLLRLDDEPG